MRPLCTSPKRLGEMIAHPVISFPARVTLSSCGRWRWGGGSLLELSNISLEEGMMQAK